MATAVAVLVTTPSLRTHASDGDLARPNILLVVIDTLRRDHVGCYGYQRNTTPALDRLAAEGTRFDQAVAASSWTLPSVMSIFTGVSPSAHGATSYRSRLVDGLTTLAAELSKAGYQTAAITSNPTTDGKFGFGRGFELYDDSSVILNAKLDVFGEDAQPKIAASTPTSWDVSRLAIRWLTRQRDLERPFFLHLLYLDPHDPYRPPKPYDGMFTDSVYRGEQDGENIRYTDAKNLTPADKAHIVALYDGEVRYTDEHFGKVLAQLRKLGIYDDTLIVVTSDHGEEFWDHGGVTHGHTLYDELVRVPLVVRDPARIKPGFVMTRQVSHLDLMPTLLRAAGARVPEQCEGRGLFRPAAAVGSVGDVPAFMETRYDDRQLAGVRTPERKLIETIASNGVLTEVFSLADDPAERRNLAVDGESRESLLPGELVSTFVNWTNRMHRARVGRPRFTEAELDPALIRRLKAMGYAR